MTFRSSVRAIVDNDFPLKFNPKEQSDWRDKEIASLRKTVREQREKILELTIRERDREWEE